MVGSAGVCTLGGVAEGVCPFPSPVPSIFDISEIIPDVNSALLPNYKLVALSAEKYY